MKKADAIDHFGSPAELAKALSITLQAVGQWGDEVPLLRQYQLERLTNGKLSVDKPKPRVSGASRQRA